MTKLPFKQHIADLAGLLSIHGVVHIVICPGSRNAPLIQVLQRDERFVCHSIVDERSAGYVALGMARELRQPVAVVTTSGTAALNLAPAVAEAYNLHIPLVILTADRPPEYPPQFTNQRIDQEGIYGSNVKAWLGLPMVVRNQEELDEYLLSANRVIGSANAVARSTNQALGSANAVPQSTNQAPGSANAVSPHSIPGQPGPVHLNVPLEEPLYETIAPQRTGLDAFTDPANSSKEKESVGQSDDYPSETLKFLDDFRKSCLSNEPVLLVAGLHEYSSEEKELLEALVQQTQAAVITESLSNLSPSSCITHPELLLTCASEEQIEELTPKKVLLFGGHMVSKRTRLFIQSIEKANLLALPGIPLSFLKETLESVQHTSSFKNAYGTSWKELENTALEKSDKTLKKTPFSALPVINQVLGRIPSNATVHAGNSMAIRYIQLCKNRESLHYSGNRGTSGIDGTLSSAVGAAMVSDRLHVVILGDLSFVYDSNALWNREFPENLKIIVLNDHGGGIFRLLDGPDRMPFFEDFSIASHPVNMKQLAEAFGRGYLMADSFEALKSALDKLFSEAGKASVLEVDLSKSENSRIFKQFLKNIHNQ